MLTKQQIYDAMPYLSASRIHSFIQCPSSFFFKYIEKIFTDETNDSYANYGTLCHNIYENIANKKYESIDEPIEEYCNGYDDCGLLESQRKTYYLQGLESIENIWNFFANNKIEVIGAEVKFDFQPLENVPKFYGFIDLVYRDENGHLIVRDYKTSKKYGKSQLAKNIQAYFYAEACLHLYGELPHHFEFEFVRFDDKTTIITDEKYLEFGRLKVKGIWKQIENGIRRGKFDPFFCDNFCPCRSECPLYAERSKGGKRK